MTRLFPEAGGCGTRHRRLCRLATPLAALTMLALSLAACDTDRILTVEDPDVARPEALEDPSALPAILNGARSDFQVAYSGAGDDSQITLSALFTDEFLNSETFPTRIEVDRREIRTDNVTMEILFRNLQRARASAERASRAFERFDAAAVAYGEVLALAGFTYVLAGENYCAGVAFSTLPEAGEIEYGSPQETSQIFEIAVSKFDSALSQATAALARPADSVSARNIINLAKIGQGRALLNLARYDEAAAAVAGVPTTYQFIILHSENSFRQQNGIFNLTFSGRRFSVADMEGGNGLPFQSAGLVTATTPASDPRVANARGRTVGTPAAAISTVGFDNSTPLFLQLKYPSRIASVVLANGVEARLIEAEAALNAGNTGTWLTILNTLRATAITPALPALADPGSADAREDLMFRERAFWLFLTSHRLGDLRRLVRDYARDSESVFPSGDYFKGGSFGPDVNFPIPIDELNNPQATGLNNRNCLSDEA
ncbi:MAG: RagB/SusD family nutrient uptake outer membrane protein [Gemmatimonadota bacterium]|nr:RagB/SusD family nutrient uptake outer membrane protein [Gemmatimonadota bacterium]